MREPFGEGGGRASDRFSEREARRRGYRRRVGIGLLVSAVLHLVLLLWLGEVVDLPRTLYGPPERTVVPGPVGLELVRIAPEDVSTPEPEPPPPEPPPVVEEEDEEEVEPPAGQPAVAEEGAPVAVPEAEAEGADLSNAERLRVREGDRRLWRKFWDRELEGRYVSGTSRADSAIRAILGRYLDSLRLTEEEYRKARDWTFGEGDQRWGISSEGIHLGNITIPLPVGQIFSPTGPKRRELERELQDLREIQRQDALEDAESVRKERAREMRERSRGRSGGSAPPDTAGIRPRPG